MAINELKPLVRGGQILGFNRPTYTLARSLAASTAEAFTPPAGANIMLITGNYDFYVNFTTTATVPGDVTDGTASMYVPGGLPVIFALEGSTSISVIATVASIVTASFYK